MDIEIKAVVLEDLRQSPYRAHIEFEKVFRSPGDQQEQRRERWTANVVYGFRDEVPNAMLLTNPLGLVISYCPRRPGIRELTLWLPMLFLSPPLSSLLWVSA